MKTTTVRNLKHSTPSVLSWVAEGQCVEIRRRGKPVAVITPLKRKTAVVQPDFVTRLAGIYGDAVLPVTATDLVSDARGGR